MTQDPTGAAPGRVSVAVINFNGESTLIPTIDSVLKQAGGVVDDVMLVDNRSTDASVQRVKEQFGDAVRVVGLPDNRGPNPARNAAIREARHGLLLMMDNDIILAPDYVRRLAAVFAARADAGAASGQIRLYDQTDVVQYNGAFIHYAGEVVANRTDSDEPVVVGVVPTGALMVNREKAQAVGGLDEDFIFGWADGDFTFRLTICGAPCFVDSRAICYHMKRSRGMKWVRFQVRNRWWFILKHYDLRTLWLALPAILLYQTCAGLFFLMKGQGRACLLGHWDALRSLRSVWRKRRVIMGLKCRRDREALSGGPVEFPGAVRESRSLRALAGIVNALLSGYWKLIRPLIR